MHCLIVIGYACAIHQKAFIEEYMWKVGTLSDWVILLFVRMCILYKYIVTILPKILIIVCQDSRTIIQTFLRRKI